MKSNKLPFFVATVCLALCQTTVASATTLELTGGTLYDTDYHFGGMGSGRGIGFVADEAFTMNTFGIDIGVQAANSVQYKFELFASTDGHTAGSLLASTNFLLAAGNGWQDFAFNYSFTAGSAYVLNFARVDSQWLTGNLGTHYSWEPSAHIDYGVLSIVEGFEADPADNYNPLVIHTRLNYNSSVPDSGSILVLLTLGSVALVGAARRRRA
jgi:hypothetical protein